MKTFAKFFILLPAIVLTIVAAVSAQTEGLKKSELSASNAAGISNDTLFSFESQKSGSIPDGWTNESGNWEVKQDGENKVLAQTAENRGMDFNIAVFDGAIMKDVELSVDIRANSGKDDQGGGLVWRYADNKNYYIVRFNPLEDNFRFYKVLNGRRIQLESADATVPKGSWFNIKVIMTGNETSCFLNGEKLITGKDDTFTKAGKTGFWTKADAVSDFDNFSLRGR